MLSVQVERLRNRWVGVAEADRTRLDRIAADALPGALEAALAAVGVRPWEDLFIPGLHVRTRLTHAGGGSALATVWPGSLVDALETALAGPEVVRYPHRTATLCDLVLGAMTHRLERAWAWRELGLWPDGSEDRPREAAVDALLQDPTTVLPVLRRLASTPEAVRALFTGLDASRVVTLARSALAASGSTPPPSLGGVVESAATEAGPSRTGSSSSGVVAPDLGAVGHALAPVARSRAEIRPALAVLALLALDPSLFRRRDVADRELRAFVARMATGSVPLQGGEPHPPDGTTQRERRVSGLGGGHDTGERSGPGATTGCVRRSPSSTTESSSGAVIAAPDPGTGRGARLRSEGPTEWGGLFFVLNALEDHRIAYSVLEDPRFARRSGGWVLHRLSGRLIDAEPHDPARLGFCGLTPDAAAPDPEGTADREEAAALDEWTATLREVLGRRLGHERSLSDADLYALTARRARVVGDPGWLEVHFRLESVSLDARRAGLDRDPLHLGWLGSVVRFVYE